MTSKLHDRTARYLTATGWIPPEEVGQLGGLWRHPESELLLPLPNDLTTAGVDWQLVLERIAAVEGVAVNDVSRTIEQQAVDVANLRAANDYVIRDSIPYWAGVTLVQSSWAMLRASATTAMGQRALIRNYSSVGDELAASARMAHTRKGSFIIPILMPISDPVQASTGADEQLSGLELSEPPEPPERRVMRTFAEALATLDAAAIQPEREPRAGIDAELVRAGVSSQFASALHKVLSQESISEFSAQFDWSPAGGPAPQVNEKVAIPSAASERVANVAKRLKTRTTPRIEEEFVGPIRGVQRDHDANTGSVTVEIVRSRRLANVRVNVSAKVLDQAWEWARDRRTVVVNSRVRSTREGLFAVSLDAISPLMLNVQAPST